MSLDLSGYIGHIVNDEPRRGSEVNRDDRSKADEDVL